MIKVISFGGKGDNFPSDVHRVVFFYCKIFNLRRSFRLKTPATEKISIEELGAGNYDIQVKVEKRLHPKFLMILGSVLKNEKIFLEGLEVTYFVVIF